MTAPKPPKFAAGELNVYARPRDVADVSRALRTTGRRVVLVPTMGALHEGHLALVRAAKRVPGAVVVVSIFVNPLQFGAGEDLDAYPRTLDDDLAVLRAEGVEIVFAPTAADMYPHGQRTTVLAGPLGAELEGGSRPTHFAGMLTVVLKLLQIVRPDRAFFGEKDYQQLVLVRADGRRPRPSTSRSSACRSCANRRSGDVVAKPLPRRGGARAGGRTVGRSAGGHVCRIAGRRRGAGRRPRGARRGARDRRRLPRGPRHRGWVRRRGGRGPAAGGGAPRPDQAAGQHRDRHRRIGRHRRARPGRVGA